ncbi:MAG: aminoacyl-tRNA hydrolase [Phycisphaerales bacterium]|nr:aminoacyl-tRNA hydrolase [Phycisphaerales bacterium]
MQWECIIGPSIAQGEDAGGLGAARSPQPAEAAEELAPGVRLRPGSLEFSFVASGGPGGQNVNKRATKAELRVRADAIEMPPRAHTRLLALSGKRLNATGELVFSCDDHRSQERNKSECLLRLRALLVEAMAEPRVRRKTKPTRSSRLRRLESKRREGETKRGRRRPRDD